MTDFPKMDDRVRDEMWRLRADFKGNRPSYRSVLVTGSSGKEGATFTALHYAVAAAALDHARTLLIDVDLRHASLTRALGLEGKPGLRDWSGTGPVPVVETGLCRDLFVLPAGTRADRTIASLVATGLIKKITSVLQESFDELVWDSSPMRVYPDAKMLVPAVDGVILVTESDRTGLHDALFIRKEIQGVQGNVIAAIRNRAGRYGWGFRDATPRAKLS